MRSNWRLEDTFNKQSNTGLGTIWGEWDSLEPSERESVENRYERNKTYKGLQRLSK